MNLLMTAPLLDTDLDAWQRMRVRQQAGETQEEPKDEFQELSKMFNHSELDIVRKHGGNMHREVSDEDDANTIHHRPRVLIQDQSTFDSPQEEQKANLKIDGRLSGPYKHVSCQSSCAASNCTNRTTSTYFSAPRLLSAFCSPRRLFAFLESCNRRSSNASAATTASELLSVTPLPTLHAA
jgi:hypothetical protein